MNDEGMDPFIESQLWRGFHHTLISELHFTLTQCGKGVRYWFY